MQTNVAIYSGDKHRSWHVTSIQLVQPMPSTTVYSEQKHSCSNKKTLLSTGEATTGIHIESSSSQHAHVPAQPSLVKTEPTEKLPSLLFMQMYRT